MVRHLHTEYLEHKQHLKKQKARIIAWISGVLAVLFAILFLLSLTTTIFTHAPNGNIISASTARNIAQDRIAQLAANQTVYVTGVSDEGFAYAINVNVGGQDYLSYVSKDGRFLFPSGIALDSSSTAATTPQNTVSQPMTKTDKPTVELFAMAYSPYLLQIEKGLFPVLDALNTTIDFKIRFVYFSMFGEKEIKEELNQYCIQKNEPQKFVSYLKCFVADGDGTACIAQANINTALLTTCVNQTDEYYSVSKSFSDKSKWINISGVSDSVAVFPVDLDANKKYGVQGSPILFVNGAFADTQKQRDSASLLQKICDGFKTPPAACKKILSSAQPSVGFINQPQQQADTSAPASIPKTGKPAVDLFVMSYCPFGTQAEKGILPVVRTLGDKIDFKVRFVYYAMHGEKEVYENLAQYCIQKEQPDKYLKYLACFLNASNESDCLNVAGVDTAKLDACKTASDSTFDVTKNWNDKSSWNNGQFPLFNTDSALNQKFGVQGSPTLVINGAQSNAGRDSASFLAGICAAFNTPPAECNTNLSSTPPGAGFGYDSVGAATAAGCGV